MNYVTIGVYPGGEKVINIVRPGDLSAHVKFNRDYRSGRALFVNGICIQKGNLSDKQIDQWTERISQMVIDASKASKEYV